MSLLAWYPLAGDGNSRGILPSASFTPTFQENGKLGQCAFLDSKALDSKIDLLTHWNPLDKSITIAGWAKFNLAQIKTALENVTPGANSTAPTGCLFGSHAYGGLALVWMGNNMYSGGSTVAAFSSLKVFAAARGFTTVGGTTAATANTSAFTVEFDKWYHFALVANANTKMLQFYVNGTLYNEKSYSNIAEITGARTFGINQKQVYGGNGPGASIPIRVNDVRLYDHAISTAELKELNYAQKVHYSFSDPNIEALENKDYNAGWSAYSKYWTIKARNDHNLLVYRHSSSTSIILALSNSTLLASMNIGETWTFSCYLYKDGVPFKSSAKMSTYSSFVEVERESRDDGYYRVTFTMTANSDGGKDAWIFHAAIFEEVGTGVLCELRNMQFEKRAFPTQFTPSSRPISLYNETSLAQHTEAQNIILKKEAMVGQYSLNCSGATRIVLDSKGDVSQGVSASFWIKTGSLPSSSVVVFADYASKLAFGFYSGKYGIMSCGDGTNSTRLADLSTSWTTWWNHIVVKKEATGEYRCFVNGRETSYTSSNYWTQTTNSLIIGCRNSGSYGNYFTGLLDDFRFYQTAIPTEKIQALHNSKVMMTTDLQIISHGLMENYDGIKILRQGLGAIELSETDGYEALEFIQSNGSQYIDTGYYWTTEKAKIEADLMITGYKASSTLFGSEEWHSGGSRYFAHILHAPSANGNFSNYIGAGSVGSTTVLSEDVPYSITYTAHGDNTFSTKIINISTGAINYNNDKVPYSGTILTRQNSTQTAENRGNIYIFSNHNSSQGTDGIQKVASMVLYGFRMYDNGVCVRNFVPSRRLSDGAVGLLDLVEGNFYLSPNGDAFLAGGKKSQNIYFFSTGTVQANQLIEL